MGEPLEVLTFNENGVLNRSDYPWLKEVVVFAQGGQGGSVMGANGYVAQGSKYAPIAGHDGQVLLELYDHRHNDERHPHD